jgi:hypothetical protein
VTGSGALDRVSARRGHDAAESEAEGEQILHGDGAGRRHRVAELGVEAAQHLAVGELGQQVIDRAVEAQNALLDEGEGGHRGDGLGQRSDPEDGVAPHRLAVAKGLGADHVNVDLPLAGDEGDEARHGAPLHVPGHHFVQPDELLLGQRCARHGPVLSGDASGRQLDGAIPANSSAAKGWTQRRYDCTRWAKC